MMKMIMINYNEAIDDEVMELMEAAGTKNYTKIKGTFGKGTTSGAHLGDDIWPGRNNAMFIACQEKDAKFLVSGVKELREKIGTEGIKAFAWVIDELT